jgi:catalase (peroxidase I)
MAGNGYTVQPNELTAGGKQVSELQSECEKLAGSVTEAFSALAAAAGDAGVESAARTAGVSALKQFLNANAGYQHTVQELSNSATTYANAENSATSDVNNIALEHAR